MPSLESTEKMYLVGLHAYWNGETYESANDFYPRGWRLYAWRAGWLCGESQRDKGQRAPQSVIQEIEGEMDALWGAAPGEDRPHAEYCDWHNRTWRLRRAYEIEQREKRMPESPVFKHKIPEVLVSVDLSERALTVGGHSIPFDDSALVNALVKLGYRPPESSRI